MITYNYLNCFLTGNIFYAMYNIQHYSTLDAAVDQEEYHALVNIATDATIFNDWPWLTTSNKYSRADKHLFLTCRNQSSNQLVAFIALAITREKLYHLSIKTARFLQFPYGDRIGMLIHPDHLHAWEDILSELLDSQKNRRQWDLMIWDEWVDNQGLITRAKEWATSNGRALLIKHGCNCPVVPTEETTIEERAAVLSKKRRTNIKRWRKKLNNFPHQIVHRFISTDDLESILKQITITESQSWKGSDEVGIFNNPDCRDFFLEISQFLAEKKHLFVSLLYIEDELASYRYGFLFRNIYLDYSIGYLPKHRPLGLGNTLLVSTLTEAIERKFTAFDASRVGKNSTNPINEWATAEVNHYTIHFFSSTLRAQLIRLLLCTIIPLVKKLKAKRDSRR